MSVILVSLHCTVGIAMAGIYHLLYVIHVGCTIRVLLYCTVVIAMTGMYYSLYVFSSRVPVKLTGVQRLESMTLHQCVCYSGKFILYCWYCHDWHVLFIVCVFFQDAC